MYMKTKRHYLFSFYLLNQENICSKRLILLSIVLLTDVLVASELYKTAPILNTFFSTNITSYFIMAAHFDLKIDIQNSLFDHFVFPLLSAGTKGYINGVRLVA
jgi:hypothetical protein